MKRAWRVGIYQLMSLRLACLVVLTSGCLIEEEKLGEIESPAKKLCNPWECGSNSPWITLGFHELHEKGDPNLQGFHIAAFYAKVSGTYVELRPDVLADRLYARDLVTDDINWDAEIVGSRFMLARAGMKYFIEVTEIGETSFWTEGASEQATTYRLKWFTSSQPKPVDLCSNPGGVNTMTGMDPFHAVLFDDERIDADAIAMSPEDGRDWFNIGCSGHTLAKLHLSGKTYAANRLLALETSTKMKTANLKMLSGDYCGVGTPLTVAGIDLHWVDADYHYRSVDINEDIEAAWNEEGALCLNMPRIEYSPTTSSNLEFGPDLDKELREAGCGGLPACSFAQYDGNWIPDALVLSANY